MCVYFNLHLFLFLYAFIFILEIQILEPLISFRYIDDIFFILMQDEEKIKKFIEDFNSFSHDIKFMYEFDKEIISI